MIGGWNFDLVCEVSIFTSDYIGDCVERILMG